MTNIQAMKPAAEPVIDLAAVEHDFERRGAEPDQQRSRCHRSPACRSSRDGFALAANAGGSCTKRLVRNSDSKPIGILMKKTQRQL